MPRPRRFQEQTNRNLKDQLWAAGRRRCRYCECSLRLREATVDHITPLVRGGVDGIENADLACERCNKDKGALTEEEYLELLAARRYADHEGVTIHEQSTTPDPKRTKA